MIWATDGGEVRGEFTNALGDPASNIYAFYFDLSIYPAVAGEKASGTSEVETDNCPGSPH